MSLERKQLDTSSLQATYLRQELPVLEQFGAGERYSFGTTHVDIYPLPPETTSLLFVRSRRNRFAVGNVYKVEPTDTGGLHGLYVDGELVVNANGNYVNVYMAPDAEKPFIPVITWRPLLRLKKPSKFHPRSALWSMLRQAKRERGHASALLLHIFHLVGFLFLRQGFMFPWSSQKRR